MLPALEEEARERMSFAGKGKATPPDPGQARDIAGEAFGISGRGRPEKGCQSVTLSDFGWTIKQLEEKAPSAG